MPDFNRTEISALPPNVAINTLIEEGARVEPERTRGYLGASILGNICARRIQYDWMCDPEHSLRLRDIFDRGHFFEAQSRERFIQAGFKFAEADRLKFEALDGMLRGHADGILVDGPKIPGVGYPCVWEHKGVNNKGWLGLERDGLEKAYPQYAVQIALYQKFLGVDEHPAILTALNADSCERMHVLVPYDADCSKRYIEQAQRIIEATRRGELLERFTGDPNHYRCKMCGHRARCWR